MTFEGLEEIEVRKGKVRVRGSCIVVLLLDAVGIGTGVEGKERIFKR